MTPEQIDDLHAAAYANLQSLTDTLWRMGGRPTDEILAINPSAPKMGEFRLLHGFPGPCPWAHLDGGWNARGRDLFELVQYFTGKDREHAIRWTWEAMRRAGPASPQRTANASSAFRAAEPTRTAGRVGNPLRAG